MKRRGKQTGDKATRVGSSIAGSASLRALAFSACWLGLTRGEPADLPAGAVAVVAATWASLHLTPPGDSHVRPLRLVGFSIRFLLQSVLAGADVAWRALAPRVRLQPGTLTCSTRFPPGTTRNAFCAVTSLLPGTLPSGRSTDGGLLIHCLDLSQPVTDQLAAEEARFARMLGGTDVHD